MKIMIQEKRLEKGFTQEDLAELASVSRQTIISLEKGKYKPSLILALKLAKIFECLVEELFIMEEGDY